MYRRFHEPWNHFSEILAPLGEDVCRKYGFYPPVSRHRMTANINMCWVQSSFYLEWYVTLCHQSALMRHWRITLSKYNLYLALCLHDGKLPWSGSDTTWLKCMLLITSFKGLAFCQFAAKPFTRQWFQLIPDETGSNLIPGFNMYTLKEGVISSNKAWSQLMHIDTYRQILFMRIWTVAPSPQTPPHSRG